MSRFDQLSEKQKVACRVIADHARATAFAIADGILPGNEGRNYVLRKIMRRAIYHGREHLFIREEFFYKVCLKVIELMGESYPELRRQKDFIEKIVRLEEKRFADTLTVGLERLSEINISSDSVFDEELAKTLARLYDTFGTPRDLIRVFLEEKGIAVTEDEFNQKFDKALQDIQKQSGIGQTQRKSEINPVYKELLAKVGAARFHGYEMTSRSDCEIKAILVGNQMVDSISAGDEALVFLADTPFYAESGGQVGDTGRLFNNEGVFRVYDTFAPLQGLILHKGKLESGRLTVGSPVTAEVDEIARDSTRRNHTATHLVHAALKEVLGSHVKQAGSVVAPAYLRFDFTHYQPLTDEEITEIENLVNDYILRNEPVSTDIMALEEAMRSGAVAMFGEKYGSTVRVLRVGDGNFSMELCGGTHVRATGDIGLFKIISDEAIASGVRRIRAVTGRDAFERFREDELLIEKSLSALKTQRDQLPEAIEKIQEELKRLRRENEQLKIQAAINQGNGGGSRSQELARDISGVKVLARVVEGIDANAGRQLSDELLAQLKTGVVILGRLENGKAGLIVRVSPDLINRIKAGEVIKAIAPIVGGKGGGKPDMAEGGGPQVENLDKAIEKSFEILENML
jgi:alanyl-tRNA synthetase